MATRARAVQYVPRFDGHLEGHFVFGNREPSGLDQSELGEAHRLDRSRYGAHVFRIVRTHEYELRRFVDGQAQLGFGDVQGFIEAHESDR